MVELEGKPNQISRKCQRCWALADLGIPNGRYGANVLKQSTPPKLPKDILDMLVFHSQMENVQSCFHPYQ
jgi:hypothetical protein